MRKRKAELVRRYKWQIWWRRHTTFGEVFYPTVVISPEELGFQMS